MFLEALNTIAQKRRRALRRHALWWTMAAFLATALVASGIDVGLGLPRPLRWAILGSAVIGAAWIFLRTGGREARRTDATQAARLAEAASPEWGQAIRTAADVVSGHTKAGPTVAAALVASASARISSLEVAPLVTPPRLRQARWLAGGVAAVLAALAAFSVDFRSGLARFIGRDVSFTRVAASVAPAPLVPDQPARLVADLSGRPMDHATAFWRPTGGEWKKEAMTRVSGRQFDFVIGPQQQDIEYYATAGDGKSTVVRVPCVIPAAVESIEAQLTPPGYTGLPAQKQSSGDLAGLEGTEVALQLQFSKAVRAVRFVPTKGQPVNLQVADRTARGVVTLPASSGTWHVDGTDAQGHRIGSKDWQLAGKPDLPPSVRLLEPTDETSATAIWELPARIRAQDDVGLAEVGVTLRVGGVEKSVMEKSFSAADAKDVAELATVFLESLPLHITDNVQVFAWATDRKPRKAGARSVTPIANIDIRQFQIRHIEAAECACAGECLNLVEKSITAQRLALTDIFQLREASGWRDVTGGELATAAEHEQAVAEVVGELQAKVEEAAQSGFDLAKETRLVQAALDNANASTMALAKPDLPGANKSADAALTSLMQLRRDVMKKLSKGGKMKKPKDKSEPGEMPVLAKLAKRLEAVADQEDDLAGRTAALAQGAPCPPALIEEQRSAVTEVGEISTELDRVIGLSALIRERMTATEQKVGRAETAVSLSADEKTTTLREAAAEARELAAHLNLKENGGKEEALAAMEQRAKDAKKKLAECASCQGACSGGKSSSESTSMSPATARELAQRAATHADVLTQSASAEGEKPKAGPSAEEAANLAKDMQSFADKVEKKVADGKGPEADAGIAADAGQLAAKHDALAGALSQAVAAARQSQLDKLAALQRQAQDLARRAGQSEATGAPRLTSSRPPRAATAGSQDANGPTEGGRPPEQGQPIAPTEIAAFASAIAEVKDNELKEMVRYLENPNPRALYSIFTMSEQRLAALVAAMGNRSTALARRPAQAPAGYRRAVDDYFQALSDDFADEDWQGDDSPKR